ncbi:MAG: hypothetical protein ACC700_15155, partial [Anaerolineales bacterium]
MAPSWIPAQTTREPPRSTQTATNTPRLTKTPRPTVDLAATPTDRPIVAPVAATERTGTERSWQLVLEILGVNGWDDPAMTAVEAELEAHGVDLMVYYDAL